MAMTAMVIRVSHDNKDEEAQLCPWRQGGKANCNNKSISEAQREGSGEQISILSLAGPLMEAQVTAQPLSSPRLPDWS